MGLLIVCFCVLMAPFTLVVVIHMASWVWEGQREGQSPLRPWSGNPNLSQLNPELSQLNPNFIPVLFEAWYISRAGGDIAFCLMPRELSSPVDPTHVGS